jgi:hypothetical protein
MHKIPKYLSIQNYLNEDVANFTGIYIIRHVLHSVLQKGGNKWPSH